MIFQDVVIGAEFRWRGATWTKTGQDHATTPGREDPEHVPLNDAVNTEEPTTETESPQ